MKKAPRVPAALLAALLLASCGSGTAQTDGTSDSTGETSTEPEETKDPLMDDLGEYDFGGYEYRVLSAEYDPNGTFVLFDTEEETGEVLVDSLYKRNREIEERFNIKFVASEDNYDNNFKTLRQTALAQEDAYDMIMLINRNAFSVAVEGLLMPVSKLTHLNLEKDYYLHDINDALTINGKRFLVYSEESVYTFERAAVIAFNKKLADDLRIDDLYKSVEDGKWTNDMMFTYAEMATKDIDGDGTLTKDDQWGITGHNSYVYPTFWLSANETIIKKDKDDIPYINSMTSEKFDSIVSMLIDKRNSGKIFNTNDDVGKVNEYFMNDKALFISTVVGRLFAFRDMKTDFGVIPYPKYDEAQDRYYTGVVDAWLHVVPVTNPDPERTSVIMEALASGSARYVFPAYYEKAMSQKVLRDEKSVEMMELIQSTRIIDMGQCPWNDTFVVPYLYQVILGQSDQLASLNASIKDKALATIQEAIDFAGTLE